MKTIQEHLTSVWKTAENDMERIEMARRETVCAVYCVSIYTLTQYTAHTPHRSYCVTIAMKTSVRRLYPH